LDPERPGQAFGCQLKRRDEADPGLERDDEEVDQLGQFVVDGFGSLASAPLQDEHRQDPTRESEEEDPDDDHRDWETGNSREPEPEEWQAAGEQDAIPDDHPRAGVVESGGDQFLPDRALTAGCDAGGKAPDSVRDFCDGSGPLVWWRFDVPFSGEAVRSDLFDRLSRPRMREAPALEDERHRSSDQQQAQDEDE